MVDKGLHNQISQKNRKLKIALQKLGRLKFSMTTNKKGNLTFLTWLLIYVKVLYICACIYSHKLHNMFHTAPLITYPTPFNSDYF